MELYLSKNGSISELEEGIKAMCNHHRVETIMILACDENNFTPENTNYLLKECKKPLFGGIFPAIIHDDKKLDKGTLIVGLSYKAHLHIVKNISNGETEFEENLESLFEVGANINTMAVLVDGFSKRISALIEALFVVFGLEYNFIGGGAGSLSMAQKPCILTNDGIITDAAIIAGLDAECGIGVQHGWKSIAGPYKVTSSNENIISAIDFKPAFEVYKEIIDEHSGKSITKENFFSIAKAYPFGINKLGAEKVVRDPLTVNNNDLICVGEMPEGAFIDVLNGNDKTLINAAKKASELSASEIEGETIAFRLLFDCISRVLFLEDSFSEELNAINSDSTPMIGALSIGEIANNKKDYLEFYNKTAVVASFKK